MIKILLVILIIAFTPINIQARVILAEGIKEIEPEIKSYLENRAIEEDETKKAVANISVLLRGDINGDFKEDVFLSYTIEGIGGGNFSIFYQALFLNTGKRLVFQAEQLNGSFGTAQGKSYIPIKIEKNRVICDILAYAPGDAACCPSIQKKGEILFENGKLVEGVGQKAKTVDYFPLAVGNRWTYERTVYQTPIHCFEVKDNIRTIDMIGYSGGVKSGTESYEIVSQVGDEFFLNISSNGQFADDKYNVQKLDSVMWKKTSYSETTISLFERRTGEIYGGNTSTSILGYINPGKTWKVRTVDGKLLRKFSCARGEATQTPAGTFSDVIMIIDEYDYQMKPGKIQDISFYANGVGLIVKIQLDPQGDPTYILELSEFNVE